MTATNEELLTKLQGYRMDKWEKRAQAMCMRSYVVNPKRTSEWDLRLAAAKGYDKMHGALPLPQQSACALGHE